MRHVTHAARFALFALAALTFYGCAAPSHPAGAKNPSEEAMLAVHHERASRPAAALVFAPPLLQDTPPLELSRDTRQPSAFVGYPESVAEFFYLRWDDYQSGGSGWSGSGSWSGGGSGSWDRYERRAVSEKVGVLYR
jgi:hypothetical protein